MIADEDETANNLLFCSLFILGLMVFFDDCC